MNRRYLAMIAACLAWAGCKKDKAPTGIDFREEMRQLVIDISTTARQTDPDFIVIPQNGQELVSTTEEAGGPLATSYVAAISGISREDLHYGYTKDDAATPAADQAAIRAYLDQAKAAGLPILVTDYCSTQANVDDSYAQNDAAGYIGYAADRRDLDAIAAHPAQPHGVNADTILQLSQIQNYLYLINPSQFSTRADYVAAVQATNHDLLLMDLFFNDGSAFTATEVEALRQKANGGRRLVVCYMSIGEAEDYRFYWQDGWKYNDPAWLRKENSRWKGNYKVWYWDPAWRAILLDPGDSYLSRILSAGYDGVFLDIIDGFEYFESL